MAAHRYWGLLLTSRPGSGSGISVAEVEMRATTGGADQCSGGTAIGASTGGQVAANAFDNTNSTLWYNGAAPALGIRLAYDFNSPVNVVEIMVRNAAASGSGSGFPGATFGPAGCWVQWSDDNVTWYFGPPATDLAALGNDGVAVITGISDAVPPVRRVGTSLRAGPGWPTGVVNRRAGAAVKWDAVDGGAYRVAGTVGIDGTPVTYVSRRVRLFQANTGRLVREVWSAADGTFAFPNIAAGEYIVLSHDHTRLYNAVVADNIAAVP